MKMSGLLLLLASVLAVPSFARAQQYAAQTTCQIAMDGGTSSQTNTCGPVLLNYEPFTVNCQFNSMLDAVQGTIKLQTSGDGVHFGAPTNLLLIAQPDGGQPGGGIQTNLGGGSAFGPFGSSATATAHAATDIFDAVVDPTDPWLYAQMSSTALLDGGASGDGITCYFSVIQSQTLHGLKATAPKGTKLNPAGVKTLSP